LAVQRAALTPAQIVFCGENLVETLAAQRAGMLAARVQNPPASDISALVKALDAAGVLA
jgi:FMN phosphatase YigB (HAD superfamily)